MPGVVSLTQPRRLVVTAQSRRPPPRQQQQQPHRLRPPNHRVSRRQILGGGLGLVSVAHGIKENAGTILGSVNNRVNNSRNRRNLALAVAILRVLVKRSDIPLDAIWKWVRVGVAKRLKTQGVQNPRSRAHLFVEAATEVLDKFFETVGVTSINTQTIRNTLASHPKQLMNASLNMDPILTSLASTLSNKATQHLIDTFKNKKKP